MKSREQGRFNIIRHYSKEGQHSKVMATGYTWAQVQAHVNDTSTRKADKYFDGFEQTS